MAKTGVVLKSFPYAMDGVHTETISEGRVLSFPDRIFPGLVDAKLVAASTKDAENIVVDEYMLLDEGTERRLLAMSDQDLLATVARRGLPYTGPLVHAVLMYEAREQIRRERDGVAPVIGIDPNSGVALKMAGAPAESVAAATKPIVEAREAVADKARDGARAADAKAAKGDTKEQLKEATAKGGDKGTASKAA